MSGAIALIAMLAVGGTVGGHPGSLVAGIGLNHCSEYLRSGIVVQQRYFDWAQGYLGGMNAAFFIGRIDTQDVKSVSVEQQKSILKNYCLSHPESFFLKRLTAFIRLS